MTRTIEKMMMLEAPGSIDKLLEDFNQREQPGGKKLEFEGVENRDVYNTTAPFKYEEKEYLVGRVESPNKDSDSQSIFFEKKEGKWRPVENIPPLNLQDPFVTQIDGELIVGGVEVYPKPSDENPNALGYLTVFYHGSDPAELKEFTRGPELMKDIRIIKLSNDKIGVFTRPGDISSRSKDKVGGMIGYTEINSLEDLAVENINKAEIIDNLFIGSADGLFTGQEWGGANELYLLENDCIGILGHIAKFNSTGEKEYYAMTFEFDPQSKKASNKKIIATRNSFPAGKSKIMEYKKKKSDDYLTNIVFSGGMTIEEDNTTELYAGLSDSEEGKIEIDYPFSSPVKSTFLSK